MTDFLFSTREAEEAAIARFAVTVAKRTRASLPDWADASAVEISDECRDHAYDVLAAYGRTLAAGTDVVDLLLLDVTEAATEALL